MELYEIETNAEKRLQEKADLQLIPLGLGMELLPLCNMNCKMCYVRLGKEEMEEQGKMLSADEWIEIAEKAKKAGALFVLLTGGEPLLYPEFKKLYIRLMELGMIVSINTNGTLIDEEMADFFAERPCRRISITLYGKDDITYERLCGNPQGFTQTMKAAALLKERKVPFRFTCSVTKENEQHLTELYGIAKRYEVPFQPATYMFPAIRKGISAQKQERLSPEKAARAMILGHELQKSKEEMLYIIRNTLESLFEPMLLREVRGFTCHAGKSGLWINWKGEMQPCGMLDGPKKNILHDGFETAWKSMVEETSRIKYCDDCIHCRYQNICQICPAILVAETGRTDRRPEYVCKYTKELIRAQIEYLVNGDQKKAAEIRSSIGI